MNVAKWKFGDNTLIQKVSFVMHNDAHDDEGWHEEFTEFISGKEATEELVDFFEKYTDPEIAIPITDERGVFGYAYKDIMGGMSKVEFWDCDEETYSEYI